MNLAIQGEEIDITCMSKYEAIASKFSDDFRCIATLMSYGHNVSSCSKATGSNMPVPVLWAVAKQLSPTQLLTHSPTVGRENHKGKSEKTHFLR